MKPVTAELAKYAIDKARADVQATVLLFRRNGIAMRGEPKLAPKVTSIKLGQRPSASILDCVDSTSWKPVYEATGKSALAPNQSLRLVRESTAIVYDGRWVIRTSVAHRDRSC
jgi:hypothetical protein